MMSVPGGYSTYSTFSVVRDWSLITGTGGGGLQNGRGGGQVKFHPYKKRGGAKSFSPAEAGTQKVLR